MNTHGQKQQNIHTTKYAKHVRLHTGLLRASPRPELQNRRAGCAETKSGGYELGGDGDSDGDEHGWV